MMSFNPHSNSLRSKPSGLAHTHLDSTVSLCQVFTALCHDDCTLNMLTIPAKYFQTSSGSELGNVRQHRLNIEKGRQNAMLTFIR